METYQIVLLILFVLFVIWGLCDDALEDVREREVRQQARNEDLIRFRRERRERERELDRQTTNGAGSQPTGTPPRTTERPERSELVKASLFSRTLEHGDSVRTLAMLLKVAGDQDEEGSTREGWGGYFGLGFSIARTWRSARSSVRTMMGAAPECSICLERYAEGETVAWPKADACDHIFHEDCLCQWLANHDECPLCRTKLVGLVDVDGEASGVGDEESEVPHYWYREERAES